MKLKNISNWSDIHALEPLLFFAQRIDELLFDYTLDTYKAPALNPPFLCKEALLLLDEVERGNIDPQNLVHILEELEWAIRNDPIAKKLIELDITSLILGEEAKNQIHKQRNLLEIIDKSIAPDIYLFTIQEELLIALNTNKKQTINQLARTWLTTLVNWGISKRHLFQITERFFFGTQPISSIGNAKEFFLECMPTTHHFEVYFLAKKEIGKFDKTLKAFDINILDDLPEEVKAIADQHGLTREEGEVFIEVSEISSYDIHSGFRAAEERMDNVRDLVLLYSHKKPITWKSTAIVKQCCLSHPVIVTSPKSAVQRIADLRPQLAAPRLQYLLGKVCTTPAAARVDARCFRWRQPQCDFGHSRADLRPSTDPLGRCGRTHPRASLKSVRRTIHRLESANSVCNCAVFLAKPR